MTMMRRWRIIWNADADDGESLGLGGRGYRHSLTGYGGGSNASGDAGEGVTPSQPTAAAQPATAATITTPANRSMTRGTNASMDEDTIRWGELDHFNVWLHCT